MDVSLQEILKDFPAGPLDLYRKKATFKWQDLSLLMNGENSLLLKVEESESSFAHSIPLFFNKSLSDV